MKVLMLPHLSQLKTLTSGIDQVIHYYFKYLPDYGVTLTEPGVDDYDIVAGHIGQGKDLPRFAVHHLHGMHWTGDYEYGPWYYRQNAELIDACRKARALTVPSPWVAEPFQRDMRINPHVVPHGIEWDNWQSDAPVGDYVLWNKNRNIGVCDPQPIMELALRVPKGRFVSTFRHKTFVKPSNVSITGVVPHNEMKKLVQSALVYLSSVKETFSIGVLEAMASGVPVLGYDYGGNSVLVEHGTNGYLSRPGDIDDLAEGLHYVLKHRKVLGDNAREAAKKWTWQAACQQIADIYRAVAWARDRPMVIEPSLYEYQRDTGDTAE